MTTRIDPTSARLARAGLLSYPDASLPASVVDLLTEHLVELRRSVASDAWPDVLTRSIGTLGTGYGLFRALRRQALATSADGDTRVAAGTSLRARRRAAVRCQGGDRVLAVSRDHLQPGQTAAVHLLDRLVELRSAPVVEPQVHQDVTLAALSRGLLGTVHCKFNLAHEALAGSRAAVTSSELHDSFAALVSEFQDQLRAAELAVYSELARSRFVEHATSAAAELTALIEDRLPLLARAQARAALGTRALREEGRGKAAEKLGAVAATAGLLTREAVAAHTAGYRLMLELARSEPAEKVAALRRDAAWLPFCGEIPAGEHTELARLDQVDDGALIEVAGFVTSMEVFEDSGGRLISRVELVDASSGATACASVESLHLPHIGVTEGAYVRLSGRYRERSRRCRGQSGIEVDRLDLAKLAGSSWWLAFLRSARRWYEPWRNGFSMCWSLGPHEREARVRRDVRLGASELLYLLLSRG